MTRTTSFLLSGVAFAAMSVALASCSKDARFIGSWTAAAPATVASANPDEPELTSQLNIDFTESASKDGGGVTFSCTLEGVRKAPADTTANAPMTAKPVKGTASVEGTWSYDVDDYDDLVLSFDMSTIKIDTTTDASMRPEAAELWKREVRQVLTSALSHYTVIEDMKVSKDGRSLTFETEHPDRDHHFRRAGM